MRLGLDSIELYHVRIPLREPLAVGAGEVLVKEAVMLRVQTSRGTGWGEASLTPSGVPCDVAVESSWEDLCHRLCPALLNQGEVALDSLPHLLDRHSDRSSSKAGVEMALWHAAAAARDIPLYTMLGGAARPIPSGLVAGSCRTMDELVRQVERHVAQGYRRVKLEIRPDWDIQPVARLRQQWPELTLMVDAKGTYSLDQLAVLRNLDKYNLTMIEQPMPAGALDDSARLQAILSTPICLSASVSDAHCVREIARRKAGRVISISLQRAGGLSRALQMHEAACKAGLTCLLGNTPDLGIAAAAGLHLATLAGFAHPADVGSSSRWFEDDVLEPPIAIDAGGYLHVPDGPGYGYRPNRDKVEKYTIRHKILTS
jgi:O-succinylbenzoate synthase